MTALNALYLTRPLQSVDGGLLTISSPSLVHAASTDEGNVFQSIGFTFPLDGQAYTYSEVDVNGWLSLLAPTGVTTAYDNTLFTAGSAISHLIAPWWDDLKTAVTVGYVKTGLQGTTPNQVRIYEWKCYAASSQNSGACDILTFQACLYESGKIEYRYAAVSTTGSPTRTAYSATCGVRGDCSGSTAGHWWDFFGGSGTPPGTGGTPRIDLVAAPTGNHWPGDSGNSFGIGAYNIHLDPSPPPAVTTGAAVVLRRMRSS